GIGSYATFSWAQALRHRDKPTFSLIFATPTYMSCMVAFGLMSFISWSVGFWAAPYAIRALHGPPGRVGVVMGLVAACCGWGGAAGGRVADWLLKLNSSGRMFVGLASSVLLPLFVTGMVHTRDLSLYFVLYGCYATFGNMWVGVAAATTQDIVLPHMRGAAAA